MSADFTIFFGSIDNTSPDFVRELNRFEDLNINMNHTSKSSWSCSVPYDTSFQTDVFERVFIVNGESDVIFTGVLEEVTSDAGGMTELGGRGVIVEEEYDSSTVTYQRMFVIDAIEQFATQEMSFDWQLDGDLQLNEIYDEEEDNINPQVSNGRSTDDTSPIIDDAGPSSEAPYHATTGRPFDCNNENFFTSTGSVAVIDKTPEEDEDPEWSRNAAVRMGESSGTHTFTHSREFEYRVEDWEFPIRMASTDSPDEIRIYQDSTLVASWNPPDDEIEKSWFEPINDATFTTENLISEIDGGIDISIEVDTSNTTSYVDLDVVAIQDARFEYSTPDSLINDTLAYAGPEDTPARQSIEFETFEGDVQTAANVVADFGTRVGPVLSDFNEFEARITNETGETETITSTDTSNEAPRLAGFSALWGDTTQTVDVEIDVIRSEPDNMSGLAGDTDKTGVYSQFSLERLTIAQGDADNFSYIIDDEFVGSNLEIFDELHSRGAFRYTVDYGPTGDISINTFKFGQTNVTPDEFRTIDYSRGTDVSEYANKVTLVGADGIKETAQSDVEINRLDKVVHKTINNPELDSPSAVSTRVWAELSSRINEAEESGSMESVPVPMLPGYTYVFNEFSNYFFDELFTAGHYAVAGDPVNHFVQEDSFAPDAPNDYVFEILVDPDLSELDDGEYFTVYEQVNGIDVRVYADGRLYVNGEFSAAGLISERETNRITILQYENVFDAEFFGAAWVDGGDENNEDVSFSVEEPVEFDNTFVSTNTPRGINTIARNNPWTSLFDDVAAHWSVEGGEKGDDIYDYSDTDYRLELSGFSTDENYLTDDSPHGTYVDLTGSESYEVNDSSFLSIDDGTDEIGMLGWFRADSLAPENFDEEQTYYYLFRDGARHSDGTTTDLDNGFALGINENGALELVIEADDSSYTDVTIVSDADMSDFGWHQVGLDISRVTNEARVWFDGELLRTVTIPDADYSNTSSFQVGNNALGDGGQDFDGAFTKLYAFGHTLTTEPETHTERTDNAGGFTGAIDDIRYWSDDSDILSDGSGDSYTFAPSGTYSTDPIVDETGETPLQTVLNAPYTDLTQSWEGSVLLDETIRYYNNFERGTRDSYVTQLHVDFVGETLFNNGLVVPETSATVDEIQYELGMDGGVMSLNFDIGRNIDVELSKLSKRLRLAERNV